MTSVAHGPAGERGIGRRWFVVRVALLVLALVCVSTAIALHPALAARYLSSDGDLAASSRRLLYIIQSGLLLAAGSGMFAWRAWRVCTPARERAVLGAAMLFGSLAVSAVTVEAGLTIVHRFVKPLGAERHYFFQHDRVLGWKHRPRSVATFKESLVRIDAEGFRVPGGEKRGPGQSRVLLLGDSQAFGDGVAAEDTFAVRLETDVPGLRVLNASVIGYGTDQQLLYFEQQGPRHAPEITVVALNAYDLRDNLSTRVRSGYAKPRFLITPAGLTLTNVPVPGDGLVERFNRTLQYRSHLYRLLGRMWRNPQRQPDADDIAPGRQLLREVYPGDAELESGLAVTAAILDRLARSARQTGSRLIVLFLPYQMDFAADRTYATHTDRVVQHLQKRAASGDFTFLDGRRALAAEPPDRMFRDAMHLSPEGHQRVAAVLERVLAGDNMVSRTHEE